MADADLASIMKDFIERIEKMATKQTALEKQIANLSIIVQGANKGPRKDNPGDARNSSSNNNAQADKNSSQMEEEPRMERFRPLANCKQPELEEH
ncbi:hypothetical protein A2U01_0037347 [Trifolium medium]|uniref:Uncharacterized protein n=1 Tax=Trifolium medium TaxID=97028 RepID=A0A392PZ04_9FABA|nr:hypothetical protein [Trifolium medium]